MKCSRAEVNCRPHKIPELKFESQSLTSFAGLVVFQEFFARINLKGRLQRCFDHLRGAKVFDYAKIYLQLIIHILLGFRELRDERYYRDDPLVQRVLGLKRLPNVATISRMLKDVDNRSVDKVRRSMQGMVLERLKALNPARLTVDFDGSVQSTGRSAEGTAVGFNKKKKGARSYYPLFATIAQTGQVFDVLHRSGNVHDSNGAKAMILDCLDELLFAMPHMQLETRMDSAFFSDDLVSTLDAFGVEFTTTVPFERFVELKGMIEGRQRWRRLNSEVSYFETPWKPQCWDRRFRFIFVRTRTKKQHKGPIQLDLFVPYEYGYEFKVMVTNKTISTKKVLPFHEGRGAQEGIFAELKSSCHMGHIPVRTRNGNELFLLAGVMAHNLSRELQMATAPPSRKTTQKRTALWVFEKLGTLRATLLRRAGRLTSPQGRLTLTVSANEWIKNRFLQLLDALQTICPAT